MKKTFSFVVVIGILIASLAVVSCGKKTGGALTIQNDTDKIAVAYAVSESTYTSDTTKIGTEAAAAGTALAKGEEYSGDYYKVIAAGASKTYDFADDGNVYYGAISAKVGVTPLTGYKDISGGAEETVTLK